MLPAKGIDEDGKRIAQGPTISDDFIEAEIGRWITLYDANGVPKRWRLRIWLVLFSGDYPQSQAMGPWMESSSSYCPCRGCNYRVDDTMEHEKPFSFLQPGGKWKLRERKAVLAQIRGWRERGANAKEMQDAGINKLTWALMEKYFPGTNFCNMTPQDIMHLFADGITRHEAAWLVYMLHSRKFLDFSKVTAAIKQHSWPRDCRVPIMPDSVKDGATGQFPRGEATIHMSASQTFTFALQRCLPALKLTLH